MGEIFPLGVRKTDLLLKSVTFSSIDSEMFPSVSEPAISDSESSSEVPVAKKKQVFFLLGKWKLLFSLKFLKRRRKRKSVNLARDQEEIRLPEFDFLDEFDDDDDDGAEITTATPAEDSGVFIDRSGSSASASTATSSTSSAAALSHAAAKHRIAVRPPAKRRPLRNRNFRQPEEKDVLSVKSEDHVFDEIPFESGRNRRQDIFRRSKSLAVSPTATLSRAGSVVRRHSWCFPGTSTPVESTPATFSGLPVAKHRRARDDVEDLRSCVNANVIFRRCKTLQQRDSQSLTSISKSKSQRPNTTRYNTLNSKERFLVSIENWALANEGFRKSIWNLSGFVEDARMNNNNDFSLESMCSSLFDDLWAEDEDEAKSGHCSTTTTQSHGGVSIVTQCDVENTVQVEVPAQKSQPAFAVDDFDSDFDACENVNVREMRKVFLVIESAAKTLTKTNSCSNLIISGEREGQDASSIVKALIMKFNDISKKDDKEEKPVCSF